MHTQQELKVKAKAIYPTPPDGPPPAWIFYTYESDPGIRSSLNPGWYQIASVSFPEEGDANADANADADAFTDAIWACWYDRVRANRLRS